MNPFLAVHEQAEQNIATHHERMAELTEAHYARCPDLAHGVDVARRASPGWWQGVFWPSNFAVHVIDRETEDAALSALANRQAMHKRAQSVTALDLEAATIDAQLLALADRPGYRDRGYDQTETRYREIARRLQVRHKAHFALWQVHDMLRAASASQQRASRAGVLPDAA